MPTHYIIILYAFLLSGCLACRTSTVFPEEIRGEQIHFGQGGGFTGALTYFVLLEDGRLFQRNLSDSSYVFQKKLADDFTKQIFATYHDFNMQQIDFYHPGDLYYFIEFRSVHQARHSIAWGQAGYTTPAFIGPYYKLLYTSTKPSS